MIRYLKFKIAINKMIKENSELMKMLSQSEKEIATNLTWDEDQVWKGWSYNPDKNRYYFDDVGNESIMGLWEDQWLKEANEGI
jgi:hypothetical protein